ncbi:dipeptidase [Pedobacter antarcticus]|uniref:dipeptidase n=1 Tax=Pedobacter antarcticus TaxID=34086 RepID=UPI001C57A5E1|nr:membrane dipeptidase [Pedobacter antarcticus]
MFTIDAHLDLSMNALEWNRDLRLPVTSINQREEGLSDKPDRAKAVVSLPELRKGQIGLVVATQIARYVAPDNHLPGWHSPAQAWAQTQGQLAWYNAMEDAGEMVQINNLELLNEHISRWTNNEPSDTNKPIGYILSLEGADSIINMDYLHKAHANGLRAIGPAHYGPGRYAQGTDATGLMGPKGHELLREMEKLNIILDATHLCDDSFWEALNHFNGHVWASHNNCRSLVNHNRQYSDEQIKALIERGAVIGLALDAWMMVPGWVRGQSTPRGTGCNLEVMINHLDHICQIAGNTLHVGVGSDLDGAFGKEQCPYDIQSIADLQNIPAIMEKRGYTQSDINNLMHGNWLRFLRKAWR